jgi:hypothetical protein
MLGVLTEEISVLSVNSISSYIMKFGIVERVMNPGCLKLVELTSSQHRDVVQSPWIEGGPEVFCCKSHNDTFDTYVS